VSYNALDFQAFLEVLWGGHIQSQLFSNKRSIENTKQPAHCQSLFIPDYGFEAYTLIKFRPCSEMGDMILI
jgi:hypothetical protein